MSGAGERGAAAVRPVDAAELIGELRARAINEAEQYKFGYHDGYEAGCADAHREIAEWWGRLARSVRRDAEKLRGTVPEPVDRTSGRHDGISWRECFTTEELAMLDGGA